MYFELSVALKITGKNYLNFCDKTKTKESFSFFFLLGKFLISMGVRENGKNLTRKFTAKKHKVFVPGGMLKL